MQQNGKATSNHIKIIIILKQSTQYTHHPFLISTEISAIHVFPFANMKNTLEAKKRPSKNKVRFCAICCRNLFRRCWIIMICVTCIHLNIIPALIQQTGVGVRPIKHIFGGYPQILKYQENDEQWFLRNIDPCPMPVVFYSSAMRTPGNAPSRNK